MKELRFDLSYSRDEEKKYLKLPFDVPPGTERIEVEYDYKRFSEETVPGGSSRREVNIVDLGIYDEENTLRGWSGSNRRSVFISSVNASPGYRSGIIKAGKWAVSLGLYKIENEVNVGVSIKLFPAERKLHCGDLHIHTTNSDGSYDPSFVISSSEMAGLNFLSMTDHNTTTQYSQTGFPENITIIPGVEFTNYRGHANFFFTDKNNIPNEDYLANSFEEMASLFRRVKASGGLISINHPISSYPWDFGYENFPFDMLEIWNGPMRKCNMDSIELWNEMLCSGKRISAVAGSDLHANSLGASFGNPCTMVFSENALPADLLANLYAGHSCLSFAPSGPQLHFDIDGCGSGDEITYSPGIEAKAVCNNACKGDTVKVISAEGIAFTAVSPHSGTFTLSFDVKNVIFYRLELYRSLLGFPLLCGLSNPVYIRD